MCGIVQYLWFYLLDQLFKVLVYVSLISPCISIWWNSFKAESDYKRMKRTEKTKSRKSMRVHELVLNLKGSMGNRVVEERCELQQSSNTTGTTHFCQGGTEKSGSIHSLIHTKKTKLKLNVMSTLTGLRNQRCFQRILWDREKVVNWLIVEIQHNDYDQCAKR